MRVSFIKLMIINFLISFVIFLAGVTKQFWAGENECFKETQALVEKMVAKYPEIVRLTIHAVPTGEKRSRIIACNIKEKLGEPSDPEDLEVMKTNKIIVLKEDDNLDVTAPICDKAGKPIAATGITLRLKKGESGDKGIEKAKSIAKELNTAILNTKKPLW